MYLNPAERKEALDRIDALLAGLDDRVEDLALSAMVVAVKIGAAADETIDALRRNDLPVGRRFPGRASRKITKVLQSLHQRDGD